MKTIDLKLELFIKEEDIENIIEMAGYGIGYWASKGEVIRNDENQIIGYEILEIEDDKLHKLDNDDIVRGIKYTIENGWTEIIDTDVVHYRIGIECGNIDSDIADTIIQYACFNNIIYG